MGEGGIAAKLGDNVVIEAMPYFGFGGASVEITGFTDGSAPYYMYGLKGGIFVLLGESVELGLEAGYQAFSTEVEVELGGGVEADWTWEGDGFRGALVLNIKM